jgi:uncharacterized protein (TIGR00645 family)
MTHWNIFLPELSPMSASRIQNQPPNQPPKLSPLNKLIMVIIGGYETFVARLGLELHPDQQEWLSHVNTSVLKTKLAMAIIGISSIHLLKTFINASAYPIEVIAAQTVIHVVFLLSAMAIAYTDRIMIGTQNQSRQH